MVPYKEIISENAVPGALARVGINWGAALVGTGAILGMMSTLMVMLYGQVRIFMVMSRDGLLPKLFSKVHPKLGSSASRNRSHTRNDVYPNGNALWTS